MPGQVWLEAAGKAASCQLSTYHRPQPLRFVWHHILPETCGGQATPANLASLCDNCHYAVHILLYQLAHPPAAGTPPAKGTKAQQALARRGYDEAVTAGTASKIPKEA